MSPKQNEQSPQNSALRRGTRTRVAKRRPGFVNPFSLRKKSGAKTNAEELLSPLSPCSEEGNFRSELSQGQNGKGPHPINGKKNFSTKVERKAPEVIHSLSTSNPKVKLIIRAKANDGISDSTILRGHPNPKSSIVLRLRRKPPTPSSTANVGLSQSPAVSTMKMKRASILESAISKPTSRKSPQKLKQSLKIIIRPCLSKEKSSVESCRTPKRSSEGEEVLRFGDKHSTRRAHRAASGTQGKKMLIARWSVGKTAKHDADSLARRSSAKKGRVVQSRLAEKHIKSTNCSNGMRFTHAPQRKNRRASVPESSQWLTLKAEHDIPANVTTPNRVRNFNSERPSDISASKQYNKFAMSSSSLPIRKRLSMRQSKTSSYPVLRRSTRNLRKQRRSTT